MSLNSRHESNEEEEYLVRGGDAGAAADEAHLLARAQVALHLEGAASQVREVSDRALDLDAVPERETESPLSV